MEPFYRSRWFTILVYALLGLFILFMLMQIRPLLGGVYRFLRAILAPFLLAMMLSYVLHPIASALQRRKMPRSVAVLLIYAVFLTGTAVVVVNVIPMFNAQLNELNEHMPQLTMKAESLMSTLNDNDYMPASVRSGINHSLAKLESSISAAVSGYLSRIGNLINMLFVAFIIPFLAFYMLKDYQIFQRLALALIPKRHREGTVELVADMDTALGNYIRGQFLVCAIVGVLAYVGYWAIGMPYPLLLAGVVAVFNVIPYVGPFFGAAPAVVMAASVSWKMVLYVMLINTAIQVLEGNIISPQVVGRTLHMHPLTIIFALLVGGELAGIVGMILAVPVFAVMKVLVQHMQVHWSRRRAT
ncbi:MAG: AI-2E family transporter [Paenibacillaceae bacterium]|uniref:AI-2E family transporter n=1 Tax=Paenibacillus cymbidii TaxID=1639034 RepID=UPI001080FCA7|nr:AI-2E family transporter [Paenibacillus cymbidii]MBO9609712.1 AI-2E family transporter [Paenibacillaceae bacterium]